VSIQRYKRKTIILKRTIVLPWLKSTIRKTHVLSTITMSSLEGHGPLTIVFGSAGAGFGDDTKPELAKSILSTLKKVGVKQLDTAQLYGYSETMLGLQDAGNGDFIIDSKTPGGFNPGSLEPGTLYKDTKASIEKLKVKQLDIFYIHSPEENGDPNTWLPTIDRLHKEGVFKRFGISNFTAEQVREVYNAAKKGGWVLPSVYQGNYSPVARLPEETLFPVLRELKLSFYAYSPLAGGLLTKTKEDLIAGKDVGRFTLDGSRAMVTDMYRTLYLKPTYLDALSEWADAAEKQGTSKADLAYRWVSYHSPLQPEQGDAIIFGSGKPEQIEQTVAGLRSGPLKPEVVKMIDEVWDKIKHEAPVDNYQSYFKEKLSG
jgi:aflatoxin B1 aldehyde reductase